MEFFVLGLLSSNIILFEFQVAYKFFPPGKFFGKKILIYSKSNQN